MTPESIRTISQLRQEFYTLFAEAMKVPVNITSGSSYASNASRASWVDSKQRLNYVYIYAHSAPDQLVPERPFILRVAINKGAGAIAVARHGKDCQGLNQTLHFELTVLPEEILDFLPWIVSLVKSHDRGAGSAMLEPPYPLTAYPLPYETADGAMAPNAWAFSHNAWTFSAGSRFYSPTGRTMGFDLEKSGSRLGLMH